MFPSLQPAHTLELLTGPGTSAHPVRSVPRAVGQPLPGAVSSARLRSPLRLRASAIGISRPRSWLAAIASHAHGFCKARQVATATAYPKRACSYALNLALDVCLALTRGLEAPRAAENGANGPLNGAAQARSDVCPRGATVGGRSTGSRRHGPCGGLRAKLKVDCLCIE
jgi:hypothetical protein